MISLWGDTDPTIVPTARLLTTRRASSDDSIDYLICINAVAYVCASLCYERWRRPFIGHVA